MNLISKINQIKKKISGQILFNENLSKYSWFNIGGSATVVFKPKNLNELSLFLKNLNKFSQIKVLGLGSNTLIRDGGYNGIIIKLGKSFSRISMFKENMIVAGSSALDKQVSNFAYENSLSGFEFLSCIPGTIGGGIRMNSGCYGKDLSKILVSLQVMDFNGNMRVIYSSDIKFSYRKCNLSDDLIFISATFEGKKLDNKNIKSKITNLTERKKKDQPYGVKTCGSTFKNPPKKKAWALIKESGCAGINIGDAYISEKHCNFFVNKGKATSQELENLINEVRKKVLNKTGVKLELELEILGEKS